MVLSVYNFDLDSVLKEIENIGAKRVLLQFPEGLKQYAIPIVESLRRSSDAIFFISMDPCYGGCDVALDDGLRLKADLIVHFGHTEFLTDSKPPIPIIYIPVLSNLPLNGLISKLLEKIRGYSKIGLLASVQHVHMLETLQHILEEHGFEVHIGNLCGRVKFRGQILGCDVCSALQVASKVDVFIVLSGGDFHALGVALSTGKPVLVLDPFRNEVRDISKLVKRTLSLRWHYISIAREASVFGILIGIKPGQFKLEAALKAADLIISHGKKYYLFTVRDFSENMLIPFKNVDVFVSAACPRIAIDNAPFHGKPVITLTELFIALSGNLDPTSLRRILYDPY